MNKTLNTENVDLVISFDTTGSMYPCLTQVRRNVESLVKDLFGLVKGIRIAIIAHGDYCDANNPYTTKILNFTTDLYKICDFVRNVEPTYGGDASECYELVLQTARTQLNWQSGKSKVLVLIGDDVPHGQNYPGNINKIDWRNELGLLLEANINVYGVHALAGIRKHSKPFYEEIAQKTGGFYLTLDQFSYINDLILAIAAKQESNEVLKQYADSVKSSGRMTRNFGQVVNTMLGGTCTDYFSEKYFATKPREDKLIPVPTGRFQTMFVEKTTVIADFVRGQGITFEKGRGFYQLTKSEKVQGYKEIILSDKETGEFFTGSQVRSILGLEENVEGRLSSKSLLDKYEIFIQSTSLNRKLTENTKFLYELKDA